jgi:hypothetical protein
MKTVLTALVILGCVAASWDVEAKMNIVFGPTQLDPSVKALAKSLIGPADYVELALPQVKDVRVAVEDCGKPNAFYKPGEQKIVVCYELAKQLLDNVVKIFADEGEKELAGAAYHQAMVFVFFHEVGHAYAALSGADLTGPEEDVADQIATYLMWALNFDDVSLLGGLVFFELDRETTVDAWDEHTPDRKRVANLACWSYGAEPRRAKDLFEAVGEKFGDEEGFNRRASRCPGEWGRIKKTWDKVVKLKSPKK